MLCPNCGLSLAGMNVQVCPRCGHPLNGYVQQAHGYTGSRQGASGEQEPASTATSSPPNYFEQPGASPSTPLYGQAAPPSYPMYGPPVYGQPNMPPSYPPGVPGYPPYGQYGQGAPVTTPFYGQAAPPSYPMYGSPTYGAYPEPGWPGAQPQPQPKRGNGLVIGLSIGLVVLVLLASAAAVAVVQNARNSTASILAATPTLPVATATPTHRVVFQDPLTADTNGWSTDDHCFFAADGYHIKNGWECFAPAGRFTAFDVSVEAKQISGIDNYPYSVLFRIDDSTHSYEFSIVSGGAWALFKRAGDTVTRLIDYRSDLAIHRGHNVKNTLRVVGKGSHFDLFINGVQVGSMDDVSYAEGKCGIAAGPNLEAVFTNMKISV